MASMFNKILCVKKTTKFERLKSTGFFQSSYVENKLMKTWQEAANVHITVADKVIDAFKESGRSVKVKQCYQLTPEDLEDPEIELVLSLGGDGTFLKTASMIKNRQMPILGVNTDPQRSVGCLCNRKVYHANCDADISKMMRYIKRENFEYFYRQRLLFEMDNQVTGTKHEQYSLNEIFVAEENVSQTSVFRMAVDGDFVGKFKSSGLIIATGTGSTGWLYSAKRFTEIDVKRALANLGAHDEPEAVAQHIAQTLSDQTIFDPSADSMYYYVREGCRSKGGFVAHAQGHARDLEFTSELINGRISIDGLSNHEISLGDSFRVTSAPEHQLKGVRFIV